MISALQSSVTGIQAFGTRIQANANNIANSATEGYKRTRVNLSNIHPQGVRAQTSTPENDGPMAYQQTGRGLELIEQSNVDLGREISKLLLNTHFYKANLKSIQTTEELTRSILDLKA